MRMPHLIGILSAIGGMEIDAQRKRDERYLQEHGWICLGQEAASRVVHWTTVERGAGPGGPVSFVQALGIQRTADAIARRPEVAS